ncbi:hypothetical protein [Endozoicomonas sp. YOMI1]|uniref:hypothetical protein n=1 Tax=Endozoicomonas sp. YOMI1 TaxID=2828739 RepID=UPI002148C53D|nr:hypothetical protein [Endozoicomonas sp. YOMI1]
MEAMRQSGNPPTPCLDTSVEKSENDDGSVKLVPGDVSTEGLRSSGATEHTPDKSMQIGARRSSVVSSVADLSGSQATGNGEEHGTEISDLEKGAAEPQSAQGLIAGKSTAEEVVSSMQLPTGSVVKSSDDAHIQPGLSQQERMMTQLANGLIYKWIA